MNSYSTQKVADLVGLKPAQVRHFVKRNLVDPSRGPRGEYHFRFQDLVLLRAAKSLIDSDVSVRKLMRALSKLKADEETPSSLSSLRMSAQQGDVVAHNQDRLWRVETGQVELNLTDPDLSPVLAKLWGENLDGDHGNQDLSSAEWCQLGVDLEEYDVNKAFTAYERSLVLDPGNIVVHVNLGRLYQIKGNLKNAKRHYELALEGEPGHQFANYNLGTLFEELNETEIAAHFYRKAPEVPDAHYNLAQIRHQQGNELAYRRHIQCYQRLLGQQS